MTTSVPSKRALRRGLFVAVGSAVLAVGGPAVVGHADAAPNSTFVFTSPVSYQLTNPCTGNDVTVEGTEHDASHTSFDGNGGIHEDVHYNSSDVRGTDIGGNVYRASYAHHESYQAHVGATTTYLDSLHFVGEGSTANFTVRDAFHLTVNADGTVTSSHDYTVDPTCG